MDNKVLTDAYRKKLTNLHGVTVLLISLLEIVGYAIFIAQGMETFSLLNRYLWTDVVLPIAINLTAHATVRILSRSERAENRIKNASVVYAAMLTAIVVSVVHRAYVVTACAFVFPLILCALFVDRYLLTHCFLITVAGIAVTALLVVYDGNANLNFAINYLVLTGFAVISYLSGRVAVDNSALSRLMMENQEKHNHKLRNKVNQDQMTNLYHHQMFQTELASLVEKDKAIFCLAMLDIDNFKRINDTYGHHSGDIVLVSLAEIIRKHCTMKEIPFRYGGEEFAVIFQNQSCQEAQAVMQRILSEFRSTEFLFTEEKLTFSCGICEYRLGMTKEEVFSLADHGMYYAKNHGKNQIHVVKHCVESVVGEAF